MAVDVLLELRHEMKAFIDLQLVAFSQEGVLRSKNSMATLTSALDKGVDVVGGIPHFERTMAEAKMNCICNPLVNMSIQGRHDTYPKRRGLMRVPELLDARINVSLGHDDVMDPWYPMGTHDMLEVAHMGAHALHMTGIDQQAALFDAITVNGAKTLNLENYGLEPGCNADMVILQASSKQESIRLRPARLFVIRRGKVISRMAKAQATVTIGTGDVTVDFCP